MTAKERRALIDQLTRKAEHIGLQLEHRRAGGGRWVWDVRDTARGSLAVHGARLEQVAAYLEVDA